MISPIVLVLGLFRLLAAWGLIESTTAVGFVYMAFNIAFTVWMLQSYFDTIPKDLEEASWMEGGSRWLTLRKVFLPLGVPAIAVAFVKYNGRPIYNTLGNVSKFITSDKVLVFHKEVSTISSQTKLKDVKVDSAAVLAETDTRKPEDRLKEVRDILSKQQAEEKELVGKIK
jgi:ABC-type glycerol-3-phosphate transport system permease component